MTPAPATLSGPARSAGRGRARAASLLVAILLAMPALPLGALPALARSCQALSAELAGLAAGGGQSAAWRKWDNAAREQQKALGLARRDHRLLGCPGAGGSCATLDAKIRRMQTNLAALERQRDRHAGKETGARVKALKQAMARRNCGGTTDMTATAARAPRGDGGGLLAFLGLTSRSSAPFEVSSGHGEPRQSSVRFTHSGGARVSVAIPPDGDGTVPRHGGATYRTMCVRMCDGFYFPVSFATDEAGFGRDAAICQARCPAAETRLFVHRNPGETIENLVSLDGQPYADLPNANRFRTAYMSGCGCSDASEPAPSMTSLTRSGDDVAGMSPPAGLRDGFVPNLVSFEVPAGSDPDTRMNLELGYAVSTGPGTLPRLGRATGQDAADAAAELAVSGDAVAGTARERDAAPPDPDRPVRIVGPRYYVAQ